MLASFFGAWKKALQALGSFPVRWLRPVAGGRTRDLGGLLPHQWLLLLGMAGMFCVPHALWDNHYALYFALLALLSYWWDCAALGEEPWNPALLGGGVWLFSLVCLLRSPWAWDSGGSLRVAVFYWTGFLLTYLTAASFTRRKAIDTLCAALYIALIYTAVYGLIVHFTRTGTVTVPIDGVETQRLCSTLEHGINYSEFVAMLMPPLLIWVLEQPKKGVRMVLAGLLLVPCGALLLTYARTGWIAMAAAIFVLLWLTNRRLLIPAVLLGGVGLFFLPDSVQSRLLSMLDFSDTGSSGRFTQWRECLGMLREHWLWGVGLGPENHFHAYLPYRTGALSFDPPHSNMLYLEMALSLGIIGFGAFLYFFLGIFPRLKKSLGYSRDPRERGLRAALLASLAGAAVGAIPEYIWFYPRILFCWCLIYGLALGQCDP